MVEDYQENYGHGWVKLYRSIRSHWVWNDPVLLKRWLTVLMEVNYKPSKFNIHYEVYDLKKGQSANSLRTWASIFQCSVKSTTKFFDMLEKDKMITREKIGKGTQATTLITVVNYAQYQAEQKQGLPQGGTHGGTQGGSTEEESKEHKEREEEGLHPTLSQVMEKVLDLYGEEVVHSMSEFFRDSAKAFFYHYDSQGWVKGNGMKLTNWETKLKEWVEKDRREQRPRPELPKSNPAAEKAEHFKNAPTLKRGMI